MLVNNNSRVAGDITGNFFLSLLINKASESANVDVVATSHVCLYDVKECFNRSRNICLIDSCFFCDLIDYVCFGHGCIVYICLCTVLKIREGKFKRSLVKRKMNLLIITHMSYYY